MTNMTNEYYIGMLSQDARTSKKQASYDKGLQVVLIEERFQKSLISAYDDAYFMSDMQPSKS